MRSGASRPTSESPVFMTEAVAAVSASLAFITAGDSSIMRFSKWKRLQQDHISITEREMRYGSYFSAAAATAFGNSPSALISASEYSSVSEE